MPVIVTPQNEIDEYYQSPAVSRTDLIELEKDLDKFVQSKQNPASEEATTNPAFKIGGGVDCLLTCDEEVFNQKYIKSEMEKMPSDAMINIVNRVYQRILTDYETYMGCLNRASTGFEEYTLVSQDTIDEVVNITFPQYVSENGGLTMFDDYILDSAIQEDWNRTWKNETRVNKVKEEGTAYFNMLCECSGKILLTNKEYDLIHDIVRSLKTNERTKNYFDRDSVAALDDVYVYYQMPIYFEYRGIACKALLDMVVVVMDNRGSVLSILPIDIKTMSGNTANFRYSLKTRRYDIQGAWYTMALAIKYGLSIADAKKVIKPFHFIVESTTKPGKPLVYKMSENLLLMGYMGRPALTNTGYIISEEIPGYKQLMDRYIFHTQNGWDEEMEIKAAEGNPIEISWDRFIPL